MKHAKERIGWMYSSFGEAGRKEMHDQAIKLRMKMLYTGGHYSTRFVNDIERFKGKIVSLLYEATNDHYYVALPYDLDRDAISLYSYSLDLFELVLPDELLAGLTKEQIDNTIKSMIKLQQ